MSKALQNNKATISLGRVELFCLFVTCSYTSMEATVLSCPFSWVRCSMPNVLWSNKSLISFVNFFSGSYLHLVRYSLKLHKYGILGWHSDWAGTSANQIVRCFKLKKTQKGDEVSSWFFSSIETRRNVYFGLWPQNTLGQSTCKIFYFWLIWLVKFNTGSITTLLVLFSIAYFYFFFFLE